jgi:hypothetical protein
MSVDYASLGYARSGVSKHAIIAGNAISCAAHDVASPCTISNIRFASKLTELILSSARLTTTPLATVSTSTAIIITPTTVVISTIPVVTASTFVDPKPARPYFNALS